MCTDASGLRILRRSGRSQRSDPRYIDSVRDVTRRVSVMGYEQEREFQALLKLGRQRRLAAVARH